MAKREKQQIVTKKHMARQEREAMQIRYITYASIAILVIVGLLVGFALINAYIIIPNKPVASVDGEKILTDDFQARVKFDRSQLVSQMINTANLMFTFGGDEATQSYFQSSLDQIRYQLTPEIHGQNIVDIMINDKLIRREAEARGITISEAEIDEFIAEAYGYFPNGTPTPEPTREPIPTSTLSPLQMSLVTPVVTEVITPSQDVPTPTQATDAIPTEAGPTPTLYTEDLFNNEYREALTSYKQSIGMSEKQFRNIIATEIWRLRLFEELTKDAPTEEEQVWARHILVATAEEAQAVMERLTAGEDFGSLAQELSTDTSSAINGGDLGWFGRGRMVAEFEEAAFSLEIGEISDPVASAFGYHIIQVLGKENRSLDDAAYQQKQQTIFNEWLAAARENAEIEIFDTWGEVYPETPAIPQGL